MKDLKKAIHKSPATRLIEHWFRETAAQKRYQYEYYRSEKDLKLSMAFRILCDDGTTCRILKCPDLEHLANIVRSNEKKVTPETRNHNEKQQP